MDRVNITIIGAGVIGLGIAYELSKTYDKLLLLERHHSFGQETSSRNSEVIHAGIYYKNNSLKAITCVEGKRLLYQLCLSQNIPHKKLGKLIVANNHKEEEALEQLLKNGKNNGAGDLSILEPQDIKNLQPSLRCKAALYSPQTGIIDSHSLMKYLEAASKSKGVDIGYDVEVIGIDIGKDCYKIKVKDCDNENYVFQSKVVINSAGLESDIIAEMVGIDIEKNRYRLYYCKGDYFRISKKKAIKFRRLIYPVPSRYSEGLGIHATPDLNGGVKLGPDHQYINRREIDYNINPIKRKVFLERVKEFLPFLEEGDLSPDTSGIRPRLYKEREPDRDFILQEESEKGLPGFINLIGIESPGLTSALSIAKIVKNLVKIQ